MSEENLRLDPEVYSCIICNESFSEKLLLRVHLSTHIEGISESSEESVSNVSKESDFNNLEACFIPLRKRVILNESSNDSNGICKTRRRRKTFHVCSMCGKEFKRKDHLTQHYSVHLNTKFTCFVCNKSFSRKDRFKDHCTLHSDDVYSCDICHRIFSQRWGLRKHQMTHAGIKPYACDVCSKSFSRRYDLMNHRTSHSGEKPYTCDICNKNFAQKRLLRRHVLRHIERKRCHKVLRRRKENRY